MKTFHKIAGVVLALLLIAAAYGIFETRTTMPVVPTNSAATENGAKTTAAQPQVVDHFPATIGTFFVTADVNYRNKLFCSDYARLDGLIGYRYAYLGDELYPGDLPNGGRRSRPLSHTNQVPSLRSDTNRWHGP